MISWRIHHKGETVSTNLDARTGAHGEVFTADYQTAGRGRLDHTWLSPPGTNLMMSAVLSVGGLSPERVSTLPLVAGLAVARGLSPLLRVARGLSPLLRGLSPQLKWPNDVLVGGRKISGILCERLGERVVVGIGVNVGQRVFPPELASRATSLALLADAGDRSVAVVRDRILAELSALYEDWFQEGFACVYDQIRAMDFLRGQTLSVWQTEEDATPVSGVCGGIRPDGALDVGGVPVYAGEAHVTQAPGDLV